MLTDRGLENRHCVLERSKGECGCNAGLFPRGLARLELALLWQRSKRGGADGCFVLDCSPRVASRMVFSACGL